MLSGSLWDRQSAQRSGRVAEGKPASELDGERMSRESKELCLAFAVALATGWGLLLAGAYALGVYR